MLYCAPQKGMSAAPWNLPNSPWLVTVLSRVPAAMTLSMNRGPITIGIFHPCRETSLKVGYCQMAPQTGCSSPPSPQTHTAFFLRQFPEFGNFRAAWGCGWPLGWLDRVLPFGSPIQNELEGPCGSPIDLLPGTVLFHKLMLSFL